jgi:hypothetical protein
VSGKGVRRVRTLKISLVNAALLAFASVLLCGRLAPREGLAGSPVASGEALGKAYAKSLAATYADGWDAAALALERGGSVPEAQKALQRTWTERRVKAFDAEVKPVFARVLPEGTEPAEVAKRSQVVALWRSFARGLKGGR